VVLSRVGDGSEHDLAFRVWVAQTFPLFESSVFARGGWIGQVDTQQGPIPDVGCIRWFDISITATGVVAHCCMDGKAEYPIGNVRDEHVLAIYNKPEYRRLREHTTSRLEVSPCSGCAFL
jgi:radical SAM protein with 4Fe4S-binding SPASM domain